MPTRWTRRTLLGTAAASTGALILPRDPQAADPLKVGYIYVGPVGDYGWTHQHDQARLLVEKTFGDKVQTSYVENVSEGPDAERVIRQLAVSGNKLIFTTSFGFMNATAKVATQFPNTYFEHCTGYKTAKNLATYDARFYEGRCVIGTIAGRLTKTNKIGYIGSFPIPEVVMGINAFTLALRKVNPDAKVNVIWVNDWYNPGKEADAAKAHFDQGADVIVQHTDSPAALQIAQERGLMGFGQASDMRQFAPDAQLTAIVDNWGSYYIERVQAALDGNWETHGVWMGLKDGAVEIAPYGPKVPEDVAKEADSVKAAIIAGELHPFQGPILDQSGAVRVPEGKHLSDEELHKMDWYVQGVTA
jgi:simple sugar transport system substrate-binding protein